MSERIEKGEAVVRSFLKERMKSWEIAPFDWLSLPYEILEEWNLLPVPLEVWAAYLETRESYEGRENNAGDYGPDPERNEFVQALLDRLQPDQLDLFRETPPSRMTMLIFEAMRRRGEEGEDEDEGDDEMKPTIH